MKMKHLWVLPIVTLLAFGLVFTGCPDPDPTPSGFTVTFDGNAGSDTVTNLPAPITGLKSGDTIAEPDRIPVREGYAFDSWVEIDGDFEEPWVFGEDGYEIFGNLTLYATWVTAFAVNIVPPENGTVSVDKPWAQVGDIVIVTATPTSPYDLKSINVTRTTGQTVTIRAIEGEPNKAEFTMPNSAVNVTVAFGIMRNITLTPVASTEGTVQVSSNAEVGSTVTVNITAGTDMIFDGITIAETGGARTVEPNLSGQNPTFVMPDYDVTITVEFLALVRYDITIAPSEGGIVSVPNSRVDAGETITITIVPNNNSSIGDIAITETGGSGTVTLDMTGEMPTFIMPEFNVTITVTFIAIQTFVIYDYAEITESVGSANGADLGNGFSMSGVNWWGGIYTSIPGYPDAPEWYNRKGAQVGGGGANVTVTKTGLSVDISPHIATMPNVCVWIYIRGPMAAARNFNLRLTVGATNYTSGDFPIELDPTLFAAGPNAFPTDNDSGWVRQVIPLSDFGALATAANQTITGWRVQCVNGAINYWASDIYLTEETPGRYVMKF